MNNDFNLYRGLAVFAGGNHIFYIMGVLKSLRQKGLSFEVLSTYSAGSAIIANILNNSFDKTVEIFCNLVKKNNKNIYLEYLFSGDKKEDIFPHSRIYMQTVNQILSHQTICNSKVEVRVIAAGYRGRFPSLVAFLGMISLLIYAKNKNSIGEKVLDIYKKIFRLKGLIYKNQDFCDKDRALKIVLGSSTIYPFIKLNFLDNMYLIDGKHSMISPVDLLSDCKHVLSIHAHETWPITRENFYQILPIAKVAVHPMDYTNADLILTAYNQGIQEGLIHYENIKNTPFFQEANKAN